MSSSIVYVALPNLFLFVELLMRNVVIIGDYECLHSPDQRDEKHWNAGMYVVFM